MPDQHARLSPSSAERWISCPASLRMADKAPPYEGGDAAFAVEGTAAHELAYIKARHHIHGEPQEWFDAAYAVWLRSYPQDEDTVLEMQEHTDIYVELLRERRGILFLEHRVDTGLPRCWGTADAIVVGPEHVEVVDLKYGRGYYVSPVKNPQLMLYGVGALETYGEVLGDPQTVKLTIYQPRIHGAETWEIPAAELKAWRDSIRPTAIKALEDPEAPFGPSATACDWCPAAGICRARREYILREDFDDDPDVLTPGELSEALGMVPQIRSWCSSVEAAAFAKMYHGGEDIPGFKVVERGGRRFFTDPDGAREALARVYGEDSVVEKKLRTFGHLEKLAGGRKIFDEMVGRYVGKSSPSPAIVPADAPGEPVTSIDVRRRDFDE